MGPDVRWVGTESGYGRASEWSVVSADNLSQASIAAGSQHDLSFRPVVDMMGDDLGSREKIRNAKGLVWYPAETDVSIRPGWFYHPAEDDKVKTPQKLFDIYLNSVGRNGVLLLNIPPDKRGLIHENDEKNMKEWKRLIYATFTRNLASEARITSSNGKNNKALLDGRYKTHFTTAGSDTITTIELQLKAPVTFDLLQLQENITIGQRIESFSLEYMDGDQWKEIARGTTVGYKRILQFPPVTTGRVRIKILSSRLNPTLSELGLYKLAERAMPAKE
jgi:alpha-L-fucosidase